MSKKSMATLMSNNQKRNAHKLEMFRDFLVKEKRKQVKK